MSQDTTRMTFGAYLKAYLKQCLKVFKHPILLLPTAILAVVWIVLGILQNHVERNLPLSILNFLTFAQGGLYGGIFGAVGGILGKIVVAAFVNAMIVPLFYKKNPFANLKQGFQEIVANIKFESKDVIVILLKSSGAALLLYSIFNVTQSFENSLVGIVSAVALISAAARKQGFLWGLVLSWMNSVTKGKVPSYQRIIRILTGMTLGFTLGILFSAVGFVWAGLLGLIALIVGLIMGSRLKKAAAMFWVGVFLMVAPSSAYARGKGWVLTDTDAQVTSTTAHNKEDNGYHTWVVDVSNIKATQYGFSFDVVKVHTKKSSGEKDNYTTHYESTFTPFQKSYQPGEKFNGEHKWSGRLGDVKIKVYGYIDTNNGNVDEQFLGPSIEQKGFSYCRITFPPKDKVNGDRLVIKYVAKIFDKETVILTYVFEWNGKADASVEADQVNEDDENITIPEWLSKLLGTDGEHTSDVITILIGILGVFGGLGGAVGGGLGGLGGGGIPTGDIPGGEGPMGGNDLTPEELEWQRYQKTLENLRKKWVHDNGDGTKTLIDPATKKTQTLYPKYNPETGAQEGWVNENDTAYSEQGLDEWLAWRDRNTEHFAQNEAQAQQNLAEQRAMNQAQNDYDRERHSSAAADAHKAFKEQCEHMVYLGDLALKHGFVNANDMESLKKSILKDKHEALEEGAKAMNDAAYWNDKAYDAEFYEHAADVLINVMGEYPGNRMAKNIYTVAKSIIKHGTESKVKGDSVWGGIGQGAVEGGLSVLQNQEMTGLFGTSVVGKLTKAGVNIGAETTKSIINDLMDPNKSASEILDNATKAGINRLYYEGMGGITKTYGGFASDAATPSGVDEIGSFAQEMGFHTDSGNALADEINKYRHKFFGI